MSYYFATVTVFSETFSLIGKAAKYSETVIGLAPP